MSFAFNAGLSRLRQNCPRVLLRIFTAWPKLPDVDVQALGNRHRSMVSDLRSEHVPNAGELGERRGIAEVQKDKE